MSTQDIKNSNAIAVIGMSGRFPGASNLNQFWECLHAGKECIVPLSKETLREAGIDESVIEDKNFVPVSAKIEDAECFDNAFFGFSPSEALMLDPQIRIFLESAWHAMEDAGYIPGQGEQRTGLFAGMSMNTHVHELIASGLIQPAGLLQARILNDKDFLGTWASYKLNLNGPAVNVQNACSTGMVAVHLACQSLLAGECEMALAGAVTSAAEGHLGYLYQQGGIYSPDGHCRAFDADSQGTTPGNGVGILLLKPLDLALEDGDHIEALILGTALNNDGGLKVSFTAPSLEGQAEVIVEAMALADISPDTIDYVEAHGTGTSMGDPVEVAALTEAYQLTTDRTGYCALGSVKTNIGHLDAAAAMAGLIKTIQSLKQAYLPPSLHYRKPNPMIDWDASPFYVNADGKPWPQKDHPRRAAVSSFGVGGTNGHAILEQAPPVPEPSHKRRPWLLLPISARTQTSLSAMDTDLSQALNELDQKHLADAAYTLQIGRRSFNQRRAVVCRNAEDALESLNRPYRPSSVPAENPSLVFMFPGQGAQHPGMLQDIYQHEPVFAKELSHCFDILKTLGLDLEPVIYPKEAEESPLGRTRYTQPALFATQYALARLWQHWGINPKVMIGHSVGEYVAACLSGVFSLEDALILIARRAELMDLLPPGDMLACFMPEHKLEPLLGACSLAAVNGSELCVASGSKEAIAGLVKRLQAEGIRHRPLHVSHAFHSSMMAPIERQFLALFNDIEMTAPNVPIVSSLTGQWLSPEQATSPQYWMSQLQGTVRFYQGIQTLNQEQRIYLEVGPGRTLCDLIAHHPGESPTLIASARAPRGEDEDGRVLTQALADLWLAGITPDWNAYHDGHARRRLSLPGYRFERTRFSLKQHGQPSSTDAPENTQEKITPETQLFPRPELITPYAEPQTDIERHLASAWQQVLGLETVGRDDNFYDLGGNSLQGISLINRLQTTMGEQLQVADLMEAPTVAKLAQLLQERFPQSIALLTNERNEDFPATPLETIPSAISSDPSSDDDVDLDNLSDEELNALLEQEMGEEEII